MTDAASADAGTPPTREAVDATVTGIWAEVLKATPDRPEIHFFDIGGTSLAAMRVITRLRSRWPVTFPMRLLFDHPVLGDFTAAVCELVGATEGAQP
ncbi:acyl carrier protein [Kitasatospora sp. LaBMicrA B282]|uniref:acyl carrier protein n=1 Tax=Kitasatospora sp. LaBMicrA B282 TaxID=3420949 RepID=UPI003D0E0B23